MVAKVANGAVRTLENSRRTPSQAAMEQLDGIRTGSHALRIRATEADFKAVYLEVVEEVRIALGLSKKEMAIQAGIGESVMSESMKGKAGRNFAGEWVLAQGVQFVALFNKRIEARLGITTHVKRAKKAELVSEIVRQIFEMDDHEEAAS